MEFSVETNGLDLTITARAVAGYRESLVDALNYASQMAGDYMRRNAPFESGSLAQAVYNTEARYVPGGAGGGGNFEVSIGIDRDRAPHADYVLQGTGLWGSKGSLITPSNGNVMVFQKKGEGNVFTRWTSGQEPQREWYDQAQDLAREIIRQEIHRLNQIRTARP